MEVPSYAGVVGDSLTSAATAYLKAINDQPFEKEALEKARLDNAHIRSQMELEKAHALHYGRPQRAGRLYRVGNNLIQDKEDGTPEVVYEGPGTEQKLKEQREAVIHAAMVRRMGGRPMEAWTPDEISGPVLRPYWELLGQGRSPYAILGDKGDIILKEGSVPTRGAPAPPPPPAAAPRAPTGGAETPPAPTPPGKAPETSAPATPPSPMQRASKDQPSAGMVEGYASGFRKLDDALLDQSYGKLLEADRRKPSLVTSAQLDAIQKVKAERAGAQPPSAGPSSGTEPKAPPLSAPPKSGTPPAAVEPTTRQRNVPLTPEAQEDVLRKRAGDAREQERLRLQQQGLSLQEQEAKLRELDRQEHKRQWEVEQKLREEKVARDIQELENANKHKDEAAAFRVTQKVMQETREARGMIQGVDETVALIQEMRRYISPETVGVKGAVRGAWQSVWGQLTDAAATKPLQGNAQAVQRLAMETAGRHAQEAEKFGGTWQLEENERARAEGRAPNKIYIPDYSKYGYDPRMRFIDFLKEVIAYAHARAMNGPGRLTDQDLNRAQKSLGIDGWINSAADMQTSIGYVEQQLKAKKVRAQAYAASVEKTLRKHRPGAADAGGEDVPPPSEE